ncbi:uncharacterized protein [Prorops nasuta]|uniref:uncharacterized protein n=1 Tax=Prorops nasuta TaxID=863751 RepID=UPI0034CE7A04
MEYVTDNWYQAALDAHSDAEEFILGHLDELRPNQGMSASGPTAPSGEINHIRLPVIDLPKFFGDYLEWNNFYETFRSIVHDKVYVSGRDEFHYLKSCLQGEAATVIKSLAITSENYEIAWDTLVARYTDKRMITDTFLDQISQVSTLRGDNYKVLKEVRDSVTVALNALKNMGYGVDQWDPIIVHSLKNKLDDTLRLAWEMYLGSSKDYPSFIQFSEFLTCHINSLQSLGNKPKTSKKESGRSLKSHATSDITRILMNWRSFRYVGVTDIVKMFRQILVRFEDRKYQNILWKTDSGALQAFELNTVTYGTGPAPFLSSRVLREFAYTDGANFPFAQDVLLNSTYVDDILFGAHDLKQLSSDPAGSSKVLGIYWDHGDDSFRFRASPSHIGVLTKRILLSENAKIFDPLGWISPIVITLKQLMQSTWLLKLSWDEEIPEPIQSKWLKCYEQLRDLQTLRIPRWTGQSLTTGKRELIGFCDASELAYGAVVYERLTDEDGQLSVHLVVSKTKVAPIKTTSIPRLELVAAALLVKLLVHVKGSLVGSCDAIRCYSDSQVALAWIAKQPVHWKTFVANRVSYIQTHLSEASWHYVHTKSNPADLCSRGTSAQQLSEDSLWWHGPAFLREHTVNPVQIFETAVESRKVALPAQMDKAQCWFFDKFSSWSKLVRVMAYVLRFVQRTRKTGQWEDSLLSASEIRDSIVAIVQVVQRTHFADELSALNHGSRIPSCSKLLSLYPANSPRYTSWGTAIDFVYVATKVWVVNARTLVKACVHKCFTCARERAKLGTQLMGSLPAARVSRSFTFEHTGVDYAGPFSVKLHHGRNAKPIKCYVAVFVCLSTRAVHLELVSRLDTEAFLAALTRFISRRGKPAVMYSDNGLNFQGADAELKRAYRCSLEAARAQNTDSISKIEWKFIPVATPHWGGLWESAVKSMKHHLKRSLRVFVPNFEEMDTLLTKIEACLNSRPISRLHDDPESLDKWSSEYLHTLQHRPKWQNSNSEFGEGDLVLVKVPNNPPRMWTLGRILKLVPGVDGVARVAVLKTARKEIQRSLSQLCCHFPSQASWGSSGCLLSSWFPGALQVTTSSLGRPGTLQVALFPVPSLLEHFRSPPCLFFQNSNNTY